MDFADTAEDDAFRAVVQDFARREVEPGIARREVHAPHEATPLSFRWYM